MAGHQASVQAKRWAPWVGQPPPPSSAAPVLPLPYAVMVARAMRPARTGWARYAPGVAPQSQAPIPIQFRATALRARRGLAWQSLLPAAPSVVPVVQPSQTYGHWDDIVDKHQRVDRIDARSRDEIVMIVSILEDQGYL